MNYMLRLAWEVGASQVFARTGGMILAAKQVAQRQCANAHAAAFKKRTTGKVLMILHDIFFGLGEGGSIEKLINKHKLVRGKQNMGESLPRIRF
jgi:hypothetical protein